MNTPSNPNSPNAPAAHHPTVIKTRWVGASEYP